MNISTVSELIQSLESAGELSIKERKYLDVMRWAIRVAGERDASPSAERVWEKTMMEACGEDGPASVASEIRSLRDLRDTALTELKSQVEQLAAENVYLLNGAARELNTSWMFHKTMLGAQAALVCLDHGYQAAAREWLEGTTDEAGAEIPDDISVGELHEWFEGQMVSNDGKSGFLTRAEAEEAIRKACPATDAYLAGIKADGVEEFAESQKEYVRQHRNEMDQVLRAAYAGSAVDAERFAKQLREGAK